MFCVFFGGVNTLVVGVLVRIQLACWLAGSLGGSCFFILFLHPVAVVWCGPICDESISTCSRWFEVKSGSTKALIEHVKVFLYFINQTKIFLFPLRRRARSPETKNQQDPVVPWTNC